MNESFYVNELYSIQNKLTAYQSIFLTNDTNDVDSFIAALKQLRQDYFELRIKFNTLSNDFFRNNLNSIYKSDMLILNNSIMLMERINDEPLITAMQYDVPDESLKQIDYADNVYTQSIKNVLPKTQSPIVTSASISDEQMIDTVTLHFDQFAKYEDEKKMSNMLNYQNIYEMIVKYGNQFDLNYLKDFKYILELNKLFEMDNPDIKHVEEFTLSRFECASIVAKALFLNNSDALDFIQIKTHAIKDSILKVKLLCLLEYINTMCQQMRENNNVEFVSVSLNTTNALDVSASKRPIRFDLITMTENERVEVTPYQYDLIVMYADNALGQGTLDKTINMKAVHFLEYPELYAVSNYFRTALCGEESLHISDLLKINTVRYADNGLAYESNLLLTEAKYTNNFLAVCSSEIKFDVSARDFSDKNFLQRELNRFASGLSVYPNRDRDSNEPIVVHVGPYGVPRNRPYQFLVELMMVMEYEMAIKYNSRKHYVEISNAIETMKRAKINTVGKLYDRLIKYKFNLNAEKNLK
nr:poly ADP-ribose glycohydrolase [Buzura suppressaria nucleopolyhedrovirus]